MEVTVGEEIPKVTRAGVRDNHLLDFDFAIIMIGHGSEWFFEGRMKDVLFPQFLQLK